MSNISLFTAPCIYFCLGLAQTRGAHYIWVEGLFRVSKGNFSGAYYTWVRIIIGKLR